MFRIKTLSSLMLFFAVLLLATSTAEAQRYRGGGRAAYGPRYGVRPYGYYYPGYYAYPWYGIYSVPAYSYYYAPPSYYYAPPTYYAPETTYYYPPPVYTVPPMTETVAGAVVRVIVPDPAATIWFDGNPTSLTGTERLFNTPPLTMGSTYTYVVRATWMQSGRPVTQERTISVTPGQTTLVDFTQTTVGAF